MSSRSTNKIRAGLLRDVFEDNLGMTRATQAVQPHVSWSRRVFLLAALLMVLLSDLGAETTPPAPGRPLLPDEEIAARFGVKDDPGLQWSPVTEVPLADLYGLGVRTIVLDPGHGGRDPGAVGRSQLTEKTVALDVARRLARRLSVLGFDVHLTRQRDTSLSIKERVAFAAGLDADILLSIHVNALETDPRSVVETFYFSARGTAATERLAARENFNSGYTIAQWRRGLRAMASTMKTEESQRLAQSVQKALFRTVHAITPEVEDWGTRGGPFSVLSARWADAGTREELAIPAALTEIGVINHPPDEERLRSDAFRERIAGALAEGILAFVNGPSGPGHTEMEVESAVHWQPAGDP